MANQQDNIPFDADAVPWRRRYTKLLAVSTLGLIFLGGQVKSYEAGLSVPDWPTTFGYNMFLFPISQMQGGIFHEHLHRLVASGIGLLTLIFAFWCWRAEPRRWVRNLAWLALGAVIVQGLLGGLTVKLLLPDAISILHGVLAQSFLLLTVVLAYAHSRERSARDAGKTEAGPSPLMWPALIFAAAVFVQLILGATMRHMEAGLAIPDFPATAGRAAPWVNQASVDWVNAWRDDMNFVSDTFYPPVTMGQVAAHMAHRYGAFAVALIAGWVTVLAVRHNEAWPKLFNAVFAIDAVVCAQAMLGISTVWSLRVPEVASLHVVCGAFLLALATLLALRAAPIHRGAVAKEPVPVDAGLQASQVTS